MQANPDEGKEFYAVLFTRYEGICSNFTAARKLEVQGDRRGQILGLSSFAEAEELFGERGMMVDPQGHLEGCDSWTWRAYRRGMSLYEFPDVEKPETLVAFCAGNAINPRQYNCHAAFACIFPHNRMWGFVERVKGPFMTFKRAGYLAILEALRRANLEDPAQSKTLVVYSNDESAVNSMRKWVIDWMYDGWVTSSGNPVKNRDLLQLLLETRGNHRAVHFEYVKAGTDATDWKSKWINIAAKGAKTTAQDAAASAKPAAPRPRLCHMPALGLYGGPTNITRYKVLQEPGEDDVMAGEEDAAAA